MCNAIHIYMAYIFSLSPPPAPLFLHLTRIQGITRLLEVPCLPFASRSLRDSEAINLRGLDRFRQVVRAFSHIKVNIPDTIDIIDINNFIFKSNSPKSVYACLGAGIAFLNGSLHRHSCVSSTTFRTSCYVIAMQRVYIFAHSSAIIAYILTFSRLEFTSPLRDNVRRFLAPFICRGSRR